MRNLSIALIFIMTLTTGIAHAKGVKAPSGDSIVDIAMSTGVHNVLVDLVIEAGLDGVLANEGQFTVFAPTDAAFGTDADGVIELLEGICGEDDAISALTNVLLHHVTDGRRFSNSVLGKRSPKPVEMLNGEYIWVDSDGSIIDGASNSGSSIIVADGFYDVSASNGVVHVIQDAVLFPATVCPE